MHVNNRKSRIRKYKYALNMKDHKIQKTFSELFNIYLSYNNVIADIIMHIKDCEYTDYDQPNENSFKKFNKRN